jgi:hypothetical protein
MNRDPRWLQRLDAAYAIALRLYPRAFRERWSHPLRQAFRDRCREVARGTASPLSFALESGADLAASVVAQHFHQWKDPAMKTVAAIASAVLFAALCAVQLRGAGLSGLTILALAPCGLALLAFARPAWRSVRAAACIVNALVLAGAASSLPGGELRTLLALHQPAMLALFVSATLLSPALNLAALLSWPRAFRTRRGMAA